MRLEAAMIGPVPELHIDDDLVDIATQIVSAERSPSEWAELESDDMIQHGIYTGGYDADERAFVFSKSAATGELWFQFTLGDARRIASGQIKALPARLPDA